jgi:hypothetical protein
MMVRAVQELRSQLAVAFDNIQSQKRAESAAGGAAASDSRLPKKQKRQVRVKEGGAEGDGGGGGGGGGGPVVRPGGINFPGLRDGVLEGAGADDGTHARKRGRPCKPDSTRQRARRGDGERGRDRDKDRDNASTAMVAPEPDVSNGYPLTSRGDIFSVLSPQRGVDGVGDGAIPTHSSVQRDRVWWYNADSRRRLVAQMTAAEQAVAEEQADALLIKRPIAVSFGDDAMLGLQPLASMCAARAADSERIVGVTPCSVPVPAQLAAGPFTSPLVRLPSTVAATSDGASVTQMLMSQVGAVTLLCWLRVRVRVCVCVCACECAHPLCARHWHVH